MSQSKKSKPEKSKIKVKTEFPFMSQTLKPLNFPSHKTYLKPHEVFNLLEQSIPNLSGIDLIKAKKSLGIYTPYSQCLLNKTEVERLYEYLSLSCYLS